MRTDAMIHVDDSSDGRSLAIHLGESVEITLAENASTGYRWSAPPGQTPWRQVLRLLEESASAPNTRPGMAGTRRMLFEAIAAGETHIDLEYRRRWQPSLPAARVFHLRVAVRAP